MWNSRMDSKGTMPLAYRKIYKATPNGQNYVLAGLKEVCVEFCEATSMHGFHLIFQDFKDTQNNYLRKVQQLASFVMWLATVVFGTLFGLYLIHLVWIRYETTPTITTIETNNYPIWNIPFPAVTVCNINAVYKPNTENLTRELWEVQSVFCEKGQFLIVLCYFRRKREYSYADIQTYFQSLSALINYNEVKENALQISGEIEKMGYTMESLMAEVIQPCNKIISACSWLGEVKNCSSLFKRSKTSQGYCCSFNYRFEPRELRNNSSATSDSSPPLIHVSGAGEEVGLRFLMNVEIDNYISARKPFYGTQIIVHDPEKYPDVELTGTIAQVNKEYSIAVQPSVIVTEQSLRHLDISQRACYFEDEKKLRIHEKYSFEMCMTECRIDTILEKCGCIPFFYPRLCTVEACNDTHRICSLRDAKCLGSNEKVFLSLEPPSELVMHFNYSSEGMSCKCLPLCRNKVYEGQSMSMVRFENNSLINYQLHGINGLKNVSVVKVYFLQTTCIKYRREVFLSWDGLFANFGGIFGLCLGGSLISLIELAYFLTFGLITKLRHHKIKQQEEKKLNEIKINFQKAAFRPSNNMLQKQNRILW